MTRRTELGDLREQMARITEMMDYVPGLVRSARISGATWEQIGDALGVSRQAAQQRYSGIDVDFDAFGTKAADL